jgi:hypothetical protein
LDEQIGVVRIALQFFEQRAPPLVGHLFHLIEAGHLAAHSTCGGRFRPKLGD